MSIFFEKGNLSVVSATSTYLAIGDSPDSPIMSARQLEHTTEVIYFVVDDLVVYSRSVGDLPGLVLHGNPCDPHWQEMAAKTLAAYCDGDCPNCRCYYEGLTPLAQASQCFSTLGTAFAQRKPYATSMGTQGAA